MARIVFKLKCDRCKAGLCEDEYFDVFVKRGTVGRMVHIANLCTKCVNGLNDYVRQQETPQPIDKEE